MNPPYFLDRGGILAAGAFYVGTALWRSASVIKSRGLQIPKLIDVRKQEHFIVLTAQADRTSFHWSSKPDAGFQRELSGNASSATIPQALRTPESPEDRKSTRVTS